MSIVTRDYQGHAIAYQDDGWFNATQASAKFGREPTAWMRQRDTAAYISALAKHLGKGGFLTEFNEINDLQGESTTSRNKLLALVKKTGLVKTKAGAPENGGGTWLHPKLAIPFARWLDVDFAVWCDTQIDGLIRGKDDWRKLRSMAASSSKVQSAMLQEVRKAAGKATEAHHFMNEHRLINSLLTGEYKGLDRESLTAYQLDFLAHFEVRNAILICMGLTYEQRKGALKVESVAWQQSNAIKVA